MQNIITIVVFDKLRVVHPYTQQSKRDNTIVLIVMLKGLLHFKFFKTIDIYIHFVKVLNM